MPMPPNPFWVKHCKQEKQEPLAPVFCIQVVNAYWVGNAYSFLQFSGKVATNPGSTEKDWFQLMDRCICVVEKAVDTVNNILYMQIYQKKLTNYTAEAIIISNSSKKLG